MRAMTLSTGCEQCRRITPLSRRRSLVRAAIFGTQATPHLPCCVQARRILNPRKVKLSPFARSTRRVLSTIEFHVECGQFLQKPLVHGRLKPPPPAVGREDAEHEAAGRGRGVDLRPLAGEHPASQFACPLRVRMLDTHAVARSLTDARVRSRPGGQRRGGRSAEDHRTPPAPPREAASDRRPAVRVPAYGPPGGGAAPPGRILGPRVRRRAPRIRVDGVPLGSGPRAARPPSRSGGRIAGVVPREMPD